MEQTKRILGQMEGFLKHLKVDLMLMGKKESVREELMQIESGLVGIMRFTEISEEELVNEH